MKILHINSYYSVSKFYKNLYDEQVNHGLDIDVFVAIPSNFEKRDFNHGGYTTISRNHNQFDRFLFHLKHKKILKDVINKYVMEDYSVIHAHSLFSNGYIAYRLKKEFDIPYIVAVRNTDVNLFFKKMIHLRKLGIEIMNEANQIIFLSKPYRDQTIENYIPKSLRKSIYNKVSIIPNGIDEFWFDNIVSTKPKPVKPYLKLLQIGDINRNKNIETTLKAIDVLFKMGFKVTLDVVGKVKDQNVFDKMKDYDFVNYLGYKPKEELINIYRENYIFVMPSIHESFGLVYAEAMSQGLPVIYTRGQGFDGQFQDGEVGYCVDCNDATEIAEKIIEIADKYNEVSMRCKDKSNKFNWDMIVNNYQKIYYDVCNDK